MGKLGLILLLLVVLLLWFKWQARKQSARDPERPAPARPPQRMLPCGLCGTHVPAAEAVYDAEGRSYCSGAHADAAARRG